MATTSVARILNPVFIVICFFSSDRASLKIDS
jgi:hypothetical protein